MANKTTSALVTKLLVGAVAMFLFAIFVLPPIYDVFCEVTGLGGKTGGKYTIYLGGNPQGTRLAFIYRDLVPLEEIVQSVSPLLGYFKAERQGNESFGDFCHRKGLEDLTAYAERNAKQDAEKCEQNYRLPRPEQLEGDVEAGDDGQGAQNVARLPPSPCHIDGLASAAWKIETGPIIGGHPIRVL